jgi:hypothetical protein
MAWASLGATTSLKHDPSSGFVRTRSEAPTSVQTTGAPVKAASPRANGRPSEIDEFKKTHFSCCQIHSSIRIRRVTNSLLKNVNGICLAPKSHIVAQGFGGDDLLAVGRVCGRFVECAVDV